MRTFGKKEGNFYNVYSVRGDLISSTELSPEQIAVLPDSIAIQESDQGKIARTIEPVVVTPPEPVLITPPPPEEFEIRDDPNTGPGAQEIPEPIAEPVILDLTPDEVIIMELDPIVNVQPVVEVLEIPHPNDVIVQERPYQQIITSQVESDSDVISYENDNTGEILTFEGSDYIAPESVSNDEIQILKEHQETPISTFNLRIPPVEIINNTSIPVYDGNTGAGLARPASFGPMDPRTYEKDNTIIYAAIAAVLIGILYVK